MMARKRISELDTLRGIAAVSVMLYHYTTRFSTKFNTDIISKHFTFEYGQYGVELFFTISGFVIYMSVSKINNPLEFVYKRFLRLYPTFWISMIITFIVISIWGPSLLKVSIKDFILNFSMIPNLFGAKSVDGVYWTLKIELFFYTFILILLILKWLNKVQILGYSYLALGLVVAISTQVYSNEFLNSIINYYYYGLLFLCGINFYNITTHGNRLWNHLQIFTASILSIILGLEHTIVFITVMIIFYLLVNNKLMFLSISPFMFIGKISYALYLIHQNIGYTIQLKMLSMQLNNYYLLIIIPIIISIIIAWIITDYIEKYLISISSKFFLQKLKLDKI